MLLTIKISENGTIKIVSSERQKKNCCNYKAIIKTSKIIITLGSILKQVKYYAWLTGGYEKYVKICRFFLSLILKGKGAREIIKFLRVGFQQ